MTRLLPTIIDFAFLVVDLALETTVFLEQKAIKKAAKEIKKKAQEHLTKIAIRLGLEPKDFDDIMSSQKPPDEKFTKVKVACRKVDVECVHVKQVLIYFNYIH